MARAASAKRHAQAVFEIALERDESERWQEDLKRISDAMKDARLIALLENPKLHFDDKKELLNNILAGINPLAMNFVSLLVVKNRLRLTNDIFAEYEQLVDKYRGVEHAEVITAVSLDKEERERVGAHLTKITGKEVVIGEKVNPALIGGLIARIGDKLIDGSTRSKLLALRRTLAEAGR